MSPTHVEILCIPRTDADASVDGGSLDFVLLHVVSASSSPETAPLDLNFIATDDQQFFTCKIRQNDLRKLRARTYHGDDKEWADILSSVFLRRSIADDAAKGTCPPLKEVVALAKVEEEHMSIVLQKNVDGIIQHLGDLAFLVADTETIPEDQQDLFNWCGHALQSRASLEAELSIVSAKYKQAQATVAKLNQQLEEFVQAKEEHETSLLVKVQELLNAKKLKIRDQQRLLASSKVDANNASMIQSLRATSHHPQASRAAKRKAAASVSTRSSDDEFETRPVGRGRAARSTSASSAALEHDATMTDDEATEVDDDDNNAQTDVTDSEDNSQDDDVLPSRRKARARNKKRTVKPAVTDIVTRNIELPVRRELPFSKPTSKPQQQQQQVETDTEDDEL